MKRLLLSLCALLLIGAWAGQAMIEDSGYVLIAYKNTSLESSLWVFLIAATLLFAAMHWLINLLSDWDSPVKRIRRWSEERSERKAGSKITQALEAELIGDFWKARRLFLQAAERSKSPALLYRQAARCAAEQNDEKEAHRILTQAIKALPDATHSFLLEQVRLDIKAGQFERAEESLQTLSARHTSSPVINREWATLHAARHNWTALLPLLPDLQKQKALVAQDLKDLRRSAAIALMTQDSETSSIDQLNNAWETLSYETKQDVDVRRAYVGHLTELGDHAGAAEQIKGWLNKHWDNDLALRFSELHFDEVSAPLKEAQKWLKSHPQNAAIELVVARLSRRNELWGAAITHYQTSLQLNPQLQTLIELTELYLQLGDIEDASHLLSHQNAPLALPIPSDADRATRKGIPH